MVNNYKKFNKHKQIYNIKTTIIIKILNILMNFDTHGLIGIDREFEQ